MWIYISIWFFFKEKTVYEMRISDWSSDVCSSDLSLAPSDAVDRLEHLVPLGQPTEDAHGAHSEEAVDPGPVETVSEDEHPCSRSRSHDLHGEVDHVAVVGGAQDHHLEVASAGDGVQAIFCGGRSVENSVVRVA